MWTNFNKKSSAGNSDKYQTPYCRLSSGVKSSEKQLQVKQSPFYSFCQATNVKRRKVCKRGREDDVGNTQEKGFF